MENFKKELLNEGRVWFLKSSLKVDIRIQSYLLISFIKKSLAFRLQCLTG